jgi:hypothetical protein
MSGDDGVYVESGGQKYKCASLKDFKEFKAFIEDNEGWAEKHSKPWITVWTRAAPAGAPGAGLNLVKMHCTFPNVDPTTMYDALHDPAFRKSWDEKMKEGFNIVQLDERNDIGYYSAKFPFPLGDRDFLNQRMWMEFDNGEYIIKNYSVQHTDCPEKKGSVRGISIITGYYLKPLEGGGTDLLYITHSDIKGSIPHWLLNSATQSMAPTMMDNLGKNGEKYVQWAAENHPADFKPSWRTPKVSWDGSKPNAVTSLVDGDDRDGAAASSDVPATEADELRAELNEARAVLAELQHRGVAIGGSLAPVAPRHTDDPKAVQQYRAIMQATCAFVDRQFVEEGRAPSLEEYLARVHSILDGIRRTLPVASRA